MTGDSAGKGSGSATVTIPTVYHSTDQLKAKYAALASSCPHMTSAVENGLWTLTIQNKQTTSLFQPTKVFMLFGEHPRELISPELGLHVANHLCSPAGAKALQSAAFKIVPLANEWGRRKVEAGNFCLRCNKDGVDLNRNWASHWEAAAKSDADSGCSAGPGPRPFSEPETQSLSSVLRQWAPHMFLSVHSGALGMYTPRAYDTTVPTSGRPGALEKDMIEMLGTLNKQYGGCPYGAAGREVGYKCPGTCLDYAFEEVKVPYTFAFEIYTQDNREATVREWQQAHLRRERFMQMNYHTNPSGRKTQPALQPAERASVLGSSPEPYLPSRSCFLQQAEFLEMAADTGVSRNSEASTTGLSASECMRYFNPLTPESYDSVLSEWLHRTMDLTDMVVQHRRSAAVPAAVA